MDKIALCKLGHIEDGDPAELAAQKADLRTGYPHMDIFGGCRGTGDRHLGEIAQSLTQNTLSRAAGLGGDTFLTGVASSGGLDVRARAASLRPRS